MSKLDEDRKTDSGPKNMDTEILSICSTHGQIKNPVLAPIPNQPPLVQPACPHCGKVLSKKPGMYDTRISDRIRPEPRVNYLMLKDGKADKTLVFLHLQKCAGTTLHRIIENQYYKMYGENLALCWMDWWPSDEQLTGTVAFKGHFCFGQEERMLLDEEEIERVYITILRDPIERMLSGFHHHFVRYDTFKKWGADGPPDMMHFLNGRYLINSNLMTYMLSGSQDNLELALENLYKFDLVGIAEEFEGFTKLLDKKMGWPTDYEIVNQNVQAKRRQVSELTPVELELAREVNKNDLVLYEVATKLFKEQGGEI